MRNTQTAGRLQTSTAIGLTALLVTAGLFVLPLASQPANAQAAPLLEREWYSDLDCNGHVDAVTLRFSVNMDDTTIRPSDWTVTHVRGTTTQAVATTGFLTTAPDISAAPYSTCLSAAANRPTTTAAGDCPIPGTNDRCFTLLFPEGLNPDGGPTGNTGTTYNTAPGLSFTSDPLAPVRSAAGIAMTSLAACSTAPCRVDSSAPMIRAAYAKNGDNTITVVFTENVGKVGAITTAPANTDFCVTGAALSATQPVSVPTGSNPNRAYRLTLTAPMTDVSLVTVSVGSGGACAPGTNNIVDTASNPIPPQSAGVGTVTVGPPRVTRIYAGDGDSKLVVEFNGPVWDGTTDITQFQSTFEIITGSGSGLTGITTGFHTSGADRVELSALGSPPNLCDIKQDMSTGACTVTNTGTHVRMGAGKVYGFRSNSVVAFATGTNTIGCPATTTPPQDYCLSDSGSVAAPYVKSFITLDTNNNGCLDAVRLLWNEKMDDDSFDGTTATLPAGAFRVLIKDEELPSNPPLATMVTLEPTTGAGAANDAITYLSFAETCVDSTPNPFGNTGILPRISFCDGHTASQDVPRSTGCAPTTAPFVMTDRSGNPMQAGSVASGANSLTNYLYRSPTVDGARPAIVKAETVDQNGPGVSGPDGYIDGMDVTFSEAIDSTSIEGGQWTVTIPSWTNTARCPLPAGTTYAVTGATLSNANIVHVAFTQKAALSPVGDTGCVPDMTYAPSSKAVKEAGTGTLTANTVAAGPMPAAPATDTFGTASGGSATTLTAGGDFVAAGVKVGTTLIVHHAVEGTGVYHGHAVTSVTSGTLTFYPPAAPNPVASGDTFLVSTNCALYGALGGNGPIFDNRVCESDGAQPVMLPDLVDGTIGSDTVYVTFSEPVFGSGTTAPASTCGSPALGGHWINGQLRAADFDYQDKNGGGATGVSAVSSVSSDCRKWQLTLNVPTGGGLSASDITAGDCLQSRIPSAAAAEGVRDGVPGAPMRAPPSDDPSGMGNNGYPSNGASTPCRVIETGDSPINNALTIDSDMDGSLDAIKLEFKTSVKDVVTSGGTFTTVASADADNGATVTAYSGGRVLCRTGGTDGDAPIPTHSFYAHIGADCSAPVGNGDFRYSAAIAPPGTGSKQAGTPVVCPGDADCLDVFTDLPASGILMRVAGPGGSSAPNPTDHLYYRGSAATGTIAMGDTRLSGFDARFWNVQFASGAAVVTGVSTGQPSTATATHAALAGTGPTGAPCHDSKELAPNVGNDAFIFVCFEELRDSAGRLLPNTGDKPTSVTYSGSSLLSASGEFVGVFTLPASLINDNAAPVLVSTLAGAGKKDIVVTISEPVTQPSGSALAVSDFAYLNGNAGGGNCPSGAASLSKIKSGAAAPTTGTGPHILVLETDAELSADDIGAPFISGAITTLHAGCSNFDSVRLIPSQVVAKGIGPIAGQHQAALVAATPLHLQDTPGPTVAGSPLVSANPEIAEAGFIDANGDGILDAVQVRFTESINDPTFVPADWSVTVGTQTLEILFVTTGQNTSGSCQNTYDETAGTGAPIEVLQLYPYKPGVGTTTPLSPYGVGNYDDTIFLCLNPDTVAANGGTKDRGTGATGKLLYAATTSARIADSFCDVVSGDCPVANLLQDIPTNLKKDIKDFARPVVLNNCRINSALDMDASGTVNSGDVTCPTSNTIYENPETADLTGNGRMDAVKVVFSEPILDSSYTAGEWSIGRAIIGMVTQTADDAEIFLQFTESSQADGKTGRTTSPALPDVGYFSGGGMKDAAGNLLRGVSTGTCSAAQLPSAAPTGCSDERDGIRPTVVAITANINTQVVTIQFSEPVGTGATGTGSITTADLAYVNAPGSTGATSIVSVSHTAGTDTVTAQLNVVLKADDIAPGGDKIVFTPDSIKEASCATRPALPTAYVYPLPTSYAVVGGPSPPPGSCYRELALVDTFVELAGVDSHAPPSTIVLDGESSADGASVTLTWTAPATFGGSTLASYSVWYLEGPFVPDSGAGATKVNLATLTPPTPLTAGPQSATIPIASEGEYSFRIVAEDSDGKTSEPSNILTLDVEAADTDKPCKVTDLEASDTGGETSVVLMWTGVAADCTAGTGKVTGYRVSAQKAPGEITNDVSFTVGVLTSGVSFTPSTFASAGAQQIATITGLTAGAEYQFAVVAIDEAAPLGGPISNVISVQLGAEGDPPGTVVDVAIGDVTKDSVELTWTASGAVASAGTVTGYSIKRGTTASSVTITVPTGDLDFSPLSLAGSGEEQTVVVSGLTPETTYFFTVAGKSASGTGTASIPVSAKTLAAVASVTPEQLDAANVAVSGSLKVSHSGGNNTLTWTDPPLAGTASPKGVQIWKLVDGNYVLLTSLDATSKAYQDNTFVDPGSASDSYKITAYYGNTQAEGFATSPSDIRNFSSLAAAGGSDTILGLEPMLFWILVGVAALLILLIVLFLVLRARKGRAGQGMADDEDDGGFAEVGDEASAESDSAAADAAPDMPMEAAPEPAMTPEPAAAAAPTPPQGTPDKHFLTCPKCATEFTATGVKPLAIQCPNCGVRGTLR